MDKNTLEQLLSSYNWWMGISTVAVALGILGEYVAHFVFEKEARSNKREMVVSILFGVLVLGGVVGEYIFGKKLSQVSEQLQQIADTEVAQSNEDAAAARREAESARKEADSFELQIAQANERAVSAERETARLTHRFADRFLTDAQVAVIANKVKPFVGQEVEIVPYWDNGESVAIANRILAALNLARWSYIKPDRWVALLGGITGVVVNVHPETDARVKQAAGVLVSALNEQGIEARLKDKSDPGHPDKRITLTVGAKR
jgi:outer membrane murein-binding lipoprotein Lpp